MLQRSSWVGTSSTERRIDSVWSGMYVSFVDENIFLRPWDKTCLSASTTCQQKSWKEQPESCLVLRRGQTLGPGYVWWSSDVKCRHIPTSKVSWKPFCKLKLTVSHNMQVISSSKWRTCVWCLALETKIDLDTKLGSFLCAWQFFSWSICSTQLHLHVAFSQVNSSVTQ